MEEYSKFVADRLRVRLTDVSWGYNATSVEDVLCGISREFLFDGIKDEEFKNAVSNFLMKKRCPPRREKKGQAAFQESWKISLAVEDDEIQKAIRQIEMSLRHFTFSKMREFDDRFNDAIGYMNRTGRYAAAFCDLSNHFEKQRFNELLQLWRGLPCYGYVSNNTRVLFAWEECVFCNEAYKHEEDYRMQASRAIQKLDNDLWRYCQMNQRIGQPSLCPAVLKHIRWQVPGEFLDYAVEHLKATGRYDVSFFPVYSPSEYHPVGNTIISVGQKTPNVRLYLTRK